MEPRPSYSVGSSQYWSLLITPLTGALVVLPPYMPVIFGVSQSGLGIVVTLRCGRVVVMSRSSGREEDIMSLGKVILLGLAAWVVLSAFAAYYISRAIRFGHIRPARDGEGGS